MASSINWLGNKVVDSNSSRQSSEKPASDPYFTSYEPSEAQQAQQDSSQDAQETSLYTQYPQTPQIPQVPQATQVPQVSPMQTAPFQPAQIQPAPFQPAPLCTEVPVPSQEQLRSQLQQGFIRQGLIQEGPPPVMDINYIPGYLVNNIGKNVRAEFIINNTNVDKTGRLISVGVNYFVLEDVNSRTHIMCDLYSVKFVTVLQM